MSRQQTLFLTALLVIVSWQVAGILKQRRLEAARTHPFSRYSEQQIIDLSKPIFLALLPEGDDLSVSAEPSTLEGRDGKVLPIWCISCSDNTVKTAIHLLRDAQTGRLLSLSLARNGFPFAARTTPLAAERAAAKALDWMRALGYTGRWQIVGKPMIHQLSSYVTLKSPELTAVVIVDAHDGALLFLNITPRLR